MLRDGCPKICGTDVGMDRNADPPWKEGGSHPTVVMAAALHWCDGGPAHGSACCLEECQVCSLPGLPLPMAISVAAVHHSRCTAASINKIFKIFCFEVRQLWKKKGRKRKFVSSPAELGCRLVKKRHPQIKFGMGVLLQRASQWPHPA